MFLGRQTLFFSGYMPKTVEVKASSPLKDEEYLLCFNKSVLANFINGMEVFHIRYVLSITLIRGARNSNKVRAGISFSFRVL